MENGRITKQDFEKVVNYCKRNHIDSALNFLQSNRIELTAKTVSLKDYINPEILYSAGCDCFIRAAYALKHNAPVSWHKELAETAKSFDMKKLIANDIVVSEGLTGIKLHKLIKDNLNFKYIQTMLEKIAKDNDYELVTTEQLLEKHFSLSELEQVIIGLEEKEQQITHYETMLLKDFRKYSKYYMKKRS